MIQFVLATLTRLRPILTATTALLFADGCSQYESIGPRAMVDSAYKALGRIDSNSVDLPEATFTIHNVGDAVLRIFEVRLSCACADARVSATSVAPNGSSLLKVRLRAGAQPKTTSAQIRVVTNETDNPTLLFAVQWEIVHDFRIEPTEIALGAGTLEQSPQVLRLYYSGIQPIGTVANPSLELDGDGLVAEFRRSCADARCIDGHFGDIMVRTKQPSAMHTAARCIGVRFKKPQQRLTVHVIWRQERELIASPEELYCGIVAPGALCRLQILLSSTHRPIATTKLVAGRLHDSDCLDPPSPTLSYRVGLTIRAPDAAGVFAQELEFEANNSASARAKVMVRGLVR